MISMKKNPELFWIFEVLLLTPIAFFWVGLLSMMLTGTEDLFNAVVGQPYSTLKSVLVTMIFPAAAAWLAFKYLNENKSDRGPTRRIAKYIMGVSLVTIIIVAFYLFGENRPQ